MSFFSRLFRGSGEDATRTDAGVSASGFLNSLSKEEKVAVSNRDPQVYEAVIIAKRAGYANMATYNLDNSTFDVGKLLWGLEIVDLERLRDSVICTIRADQAATADILKAAELYHRAMELNPFDDVATMSYGVALAQQGDVREGLKWVEHAVKLNPGNERAQRNLAAVKSYL